MSQEEPLTVKVALTHDGKATLRQPDQLQLVFDQPLLQSIAKALTALEVQNEAAAWLTMYLGESLAFFASGRPWLARGDDHDFVVSSVWMHVEPDRLCFEIWESSSDDQLAGTVEFAENATLRPAVEQHRRWAEDSLVRDLQELYAVRSHDPDAMRDMLRTRRRAEPWLEKMAINLTTGTPDDVLDGSDAQVTLRRALTCTPAPEQDAGQDDVARSTPSGSADS